LVSQGSEAGLAAALLRLATDPAERLRLGTAAVAKAATWDSTSITAQWLEIYERAVNRRSGSPAGRSTAVLGLRTASANPDQDVAPHGREGVGVTPEQARHQTLAAVVGVAEQVAADWFVLPPTGAQPDDPTTVVLPMSDRRPFLEALASADLPTFVSVHDPDHRGWPSRRGIAGELVPVLLRGRSGRLLLEPWPRLNERGALLGRGCGIAVEFWEAGPDGYLHSPGRAGFTTTVPRGAATVPTRVHDVDVPTLPFAAEPTVYDVTFPVDAVYTWVDGTDPAWDAARAARLADVQDATMTTRASSGRARYLDRGELRYSLRGLHLFAPWIRTIHVVTAGQVPPWLDVDHPHINVVDHRDILPADALPTFNSHAIEAALHRIDGLAEHFVYLNDDFFVGAPVRPEAFFTPAGSTAVFASSMLVGLPGQDELPYARAAANNRRLLQGAFGANTLHTLQHAPYAHRVSVLREIAERFSAEVEATMRAPFRSASDVSMLSSLAQHYGLMTGSAHLGTADYAFVDLTEAVVRRRLKQLLDRERAGFCLGDSHDFARDPEQVATMVTDFLETYFPIPGPWER
ncbi:MAG: stealth family protein, partial [Nocardioides sp.]